MEDDHYVLADARNELADALKSLLKPEHMGTAEFLVTRELTRLALKHIDKLLEMAVYSE